MTFRRAVAAGVLLVLLRARAAADPALPVPEPAPAGHLHAKSPTLLLIGCDAGPVPPCHALSLSPGHFYDDPSWNLLDVEMRRLQDQETRLAAENKSLRASAHSMDASWQPGWKTLTAALVAGFAGGVYIRSKL